MAGYANVGTDDFALVRYNTNGSLDTSFSGDGKATAPIGTGRDRAIGLAIQPDGKIVAVGESQIGTRTRLAVVRYTSGGALDTSFSGDGKLITNFGELGNVESHAQAVAIQPDGKILVAGYVWQDTSHFDFVLVRYNANGSIDTSFDGDGKALTNFEGTSSDHAYSMALQPDGKIVVAGTSTQGASDHFAVVRYNADGSLDTTFSGDGKLTATFGDDFEIG